MQIRLNLLAVTFAFLALLLLGRLYYWQIVRGGELSEDARNQHEKTEELIAHRGSIVSADGSFLASNVEDFLVYASLPSLDKTKYTRRELSNILAKYLVSDLDGQEALLEETKRLEFQLMRTDVSWVALQRHVATETKEQIEALGIAGIGFEKSESRFYPEASTAAQLLGFVGKDDEGGDQGYFGLEGYYDLPMSGKTGYKTRFLDAIGVPILGSNLREVSAVSGVDLVTHLRKPLAILIEEKLQKGLEKYGAKAGSIVVMDPRSGGILAMAGSPSFDPATYWDFSDELFKNPVVSDTFEPGSVFKPIVMASALDAEVINPETKCASCDGPLQIDKYFIKTWDEKYYPDSSMTDVLVHSDNVGMAFVGLRLGGERLYEYLVKFGFDDVTGIDLQGEVVVPLRKRWEWGDVDVATTSFGQGIAVTPIQLITAVSALANDGVLMRPQVVDRLKLGGWEDDIKPQVVRQVVSKEAADAVTQMMVKAASEGEAKWTAKAGFGVAGKTGTAQIPIQGHYDQEKTIASFIGFAPFDNPKFVMLVTLREPESSPWASETAAPLWYEIAKELFIYFGISPKN